MSERTLRTETKCVGGNSLMWLNSFPREDCRSARWTGVERIVILPFQHLSKATCSLQCKHVRVKGLAQAPNSGEV